MVWSQIGVCSHEAMKCHLEVFKFDLSGTAHVRIKRESDFFLLVIVLETSELFEEANSIFER